MKKKYKKCKRKFVKLKLNLGSNNYEEKWVENYEKIF